MALLSAVVDDIILVEPSPGIRYEYEALCTPGMASNWFLKASLPLTNIVNIFDDHHLFMCKAQVFILQIDKLVVNKN